jgi:hypothetical protein
VKIWSFCKIIASTLVQKYDKISKLIILMELIRNIKVLF